MRQVTAVVLEKNRALIARNILLIAPEGTFSIKNIIVDIFLIFSTKHYVVDTH